MFREVVTATKHPNVHKHFISCFLSRFATTLVQNVRFNVSVSYLLEPKNSVEQSEIQQKRQTDVGITEFMGSHPKIFATFKEKSSDFQVREIASDGTRVQLTDLNAPPLQNDCDTGRGRKVCRKGREYIHCTLYKDGWEHGQAITYISKNFGIDINEIKYSGRKDKVGQTVQRISFPHIFGPQQLAKWSADWEYLKLGNYSYTSYPSSYGSHSGNHFKILLRSVQLGDRVENNDEATYSSLAAAAAAMDVGVSSLREVGFINYFGLQRFGEKSHRIGEAIVKQEWKKAFDLLLTPCSREKEEMAQAMSMWAEGHEPPAILKCLSPQTIRSDKRSEIFKSLANNFRFRGDRDLVEAYRDLPQHLKSIYLQAFGSYLWNKLASLRIKEFGLKVLPGDFIDCFLHESGKADGGGGVVGDGGDGDDDRLIGRQQRVKMLTEEDLVDGHPYTIHDVFLPVQGYGFHRYPNKMLQDLFEMSLAECGLDADFLTTFRHECRVGIPPSLLRPLLVKPKDVDHKMFVANHFLEDVRVWMPSDLDLLRIQGKLNDKVVNSTTSSALVGQQVNSQRSPEFLTAQEIGETERVVEGNETRNLCAIIEFELPQSCYATMALREIMQYHRPIRHETIEDNPSEDEQS